MDKRKRIEEYLRGLDITKEYLAYRKKELELLDYEYGLTGISYDSPIQSGSISDTTGNQASRIADERQATMIEIKRLELEVNHIEKLISMLTDKEATTIRLYYFSPYKPLWYIQQQINHSKEQTIRIKSAALNKLARGMYGEDR